MFDIFKRLNTLRICKDELSDKNSMLYALTQNNGELDMLLIPHNKEYTSRNKRWERLPVEIDRTITNVFKELVYEDPGNFSVAELQILIQNNVEDSTVEREENARRFDQALREQREAYQNLLVLQLQQPNTTGIFDDNGVLVDVVATDEYEEYAEAAEIYKKDSESFLDLLRSKKLEVCDNFFRCKKCGMLVNVDNNHVCDIVPEKNKKSDIFPTLSLLSFYKPKRFGVKYYTEEINDKNAKISLVEKEILNYRAEILKLNKANNYS